MLAVYFPLMTVAEAKHRLVTELSPVSPSPQLDADCILQWVLDCDRTRLLLRRNDVLTEGQAAAVEDALARRRTGFPIAYITGHKEFFGYDFFVTPAVLIPKPDTELLVEQAISAIREKLAEQACASDSEYHPDRRAGSDSPCHNRKTISVCDMCTGSGCVGLSVLRTLAGERTAALTLVDISQEALAVARTNAERLLGAAVTQSAQEMPPTETQSAQSADGIRFVRSNLFECVEGAFDIIVTNPPYVPHSEAQALLEDGRSEPLLALDGDVTEKGGWSGMEDGLALIRRLVPEAYAHLVPGGMLLMETGEYNAEETAELFARAGFKDIRIERDLSGQMRDVIGRR